MRKMYLSKHFTRGRRRRIQFVVAHHMTIIGRGTGSALDACYRTWQSRQASAHYGVDGTQVAQFVRDTDAAWATADQEGNHAGISIEHANSTAGPKWEVSEATWKTGARLAAEKHVEHRLGRPVSTGNGKGGTLRKHSSFTSTACPGPFFDRIWPQYVAEAQRQYDLLTRKPKTTRIASWNVYLIKRHPNLSVAYRTSKIAAYCKKWDLDVLAVQECPSSGDGKHLFPKLAAIGLVKRVGSHGRYLFFRAGTKVHVVKSWEVDGKRVTVACATVNGRRRVFVNCHPVSGSTKAAKAARTRWAEKLIPLVHRFADATDTPREDEIYMGDFNGSEFHTVARKHGIRLVRTFARVKSLLTRTYNAWGRKHTNPGGHFDYILTDDSKKNAITKAKTFFTPKASDHNPVFVEVKE